MMISQPKTGNFKKIILSKYYKISARIILTLHFLQKFFIYVIAYRYIVENYVMYLYKLSLLC